MKTKLLNKNGFTIIEVVLSSVILIISLLGGVAFFSLNRNNLSYATNQRLATWSAIDKMEQLKSANYTDALLNTGATTENLTISGKSFTRKTTVSDIVVNGYKKVTVEMGWIQGKYPVSLTTYIAK